LIEISGEPKGVDLLSEDGLEFGDGLEGQVCHIGTIIPIMYIFKDKRLNYAD
jgi:hypothetical protein